ncbi:MULTISPECIES: DNA translocase FtsK [unclassified Helicobacter]|uniref:DNA translocase FtsK n=1 Tax=unclassified Helicobacter TaxID=2593540 RepID=UPI000CF1109A|nr:MULTISPECIES: DNA translocase FtsK [unclassified Helicobacter]
MKSDIVGKFGQGIGSLNFQLFGYLAPIYPLFLLGFLIFLYKNPLALQIPSNIRRIVGCIILFVCSLFLQCLWFQKGEIIIPLVIFLRESIGLFGIFILLTSLILISWMMISLDHLKKTFERFFFFLNVGLGEFGKKIIFFYQKIKIWVKETKEKIKTRKNQQEILFIPEEKEEIQRDNNASQRVKESEIRVFYDVKLKKQEQNLEVGLIDTKDTQETKDYSQAVIERNKIEFAQLRLENTPKNDKSNIQFLQKQKNQILVENQELQKDEALEDNVVSKTEEKEIKEEEKENNLATPFVKEEVSQDIKTQIFKELEIRSSSRKTPIIKELSENTILLDSLEKGEIQKPRDYILPSIELLQKNPKQNKDFDESELDEKIQNLLSKLRMFKIDGDIVRTYTGPLVSTFEFKPASHVKVSRILTLSDDLAMALCAQSIRIQAPIPGKDVVGIEIPNSSIQTIYMREILESEVFKSSASALTLALGKDIVGNPFVTDLKKLPHLLIAGTTGSGKSVGINAMIVSLLYRNSPENLRFIMVDPKMVEFSMYEDIPHLLTPIITDPKKAIVALNSAVKEMERRYKLMSVLKVKTIENYNQKCKEFGEEPFAFLVIIIDELADLMMTGGKEAEFPITRIAQMGRACGMHLIVATQRPSADVVTGLIKTNLPARVAFKVSNKIDSRVVLDVEGAQSLLGRGDMLFTPPGISGVIRMHAPWISESEIESIVAFIKEQRSVQYDDSFVLEERELISSAIEESEKSNSPDLQKAKEIIRSTGKTSASFLQRRMSIGYNKAATLVEELEKQGFLSAPNAKGIREIIG